MIPGHLRAFSRHSGLLLYWSERGGSRQAFLMDLRTGESKLLTEAEALDAASLTLSPDDRNIFFFDGSALMTASATSGRSREIHRSGDGAAPAGFTMGSDGSLYILEAPERPFANQRYPEAAAAGRSPSHDSGQRRRHSDHRRAPPASANPLSNHHGPEAGRTLASAQRRIGQAKNKYPGRGDRRSRMDPGRPHSRLSPHPGRQAATDHPSRVQPRKTIPTG